MKLKEGLQKKLDDKNREKIPEKVRIEQDEQMEKYNTEESNLQDGLVRIKQLQWSIQLWNIFYSHS